MLMCFANQHAAHDQSFYLPYSGLNPVAGPVERFLWQQQAQTFQDLINHQQNVIKNTRHNLFNRQVDYTSVGLKFQRFRYTNESLSNQISAKDLERFKRLLENAGSNAMDESKSKQRPESPGSDVSSGFGTMPSPISDLDSPPVFTSPEDKPKDVSIGT